MRISRPWTVGVLLALSVVTVAGSWGCRNRPAQEAAGPGEPAVLSPVTGSGPAGARPPVQRVYSSAVIFSQTWREATLRPDLFQVSGLHGVTAASETGEIIAPSYVAACADGAVFVSDDFSGRTQLVSADGNLSGVYPFGQFLGTDLNGNLYALRAEGSDDVTLTSVRPGGTANYSTRLQIPWSYVLDMYVCPSGAVQVVYESPDGSGPRIVEVSESGVVRAPAPADSFGIRYQGDKDLQYKLQCPQVGRLQICRLLPSGPRVLVEFLVDPAAWEGLHPLGVDGRGWFYVFLSVRETSDEGQAGYHCYVQVIDPEAPATWAVDLGVSHSLTPVLHCAAVDFEGTIYFLRTDAEGMQLVKWQPQQDSG